MLWQKCRLGLRARRAKKPMLCLHAVTDEGGHPLENEDESGRRLCDYWGTIFQARAEGPRHHQLKISCDMFRKLLTTSAGLSTKIRRNLLLALMEFRTAFTDLREGWVRGICFAHTNMCWRVVLFLRILLRVELSLFPSPPISTTMEGLLDHREPYVL